MRIIWRGREREEGQRGEGERGRRERSSQHYTPSITTHQLLLFHNLIDHGRSQLIGGWISP